MARRARYSLELLRLKLRRMAMARRVPRSALCLDIGSGDAPWPRADILLEARPDDLGRTAELLVDRPLVFASVEALPFKNASLDYVHASHVLEHVNDPGRAVSELERIASAGYIETPTRLHELLSPRDDHRWMVSLHGQTMHFEPKTPADPEVVKWVDKRLTTSPLFERTYWSLYLSDFVNCCTWQSHVPHVVEGSLKKVQPSKPDLTELADALRVGRQRGTGARARFKAWFARGSAEVPDLLRFVVCPRCRGQLEQRSEELRCSACAVSHPVIDGAPVLYAD